MKADAGAVATLLKVVSLTREYPNLKGLHDGALMDLEESSAIEADAVQERIAAKKKVDDEKKAKAAADAKAKATPAGSVVGATHHG